MAAIDKLIERFRQCPADFESSELVRVLAHFGYSERTGKGSRRKFVCDGLPLINLHEPHPRKIVKRYAFRQVLETLENEGLLG